MEDIPEYESIETEDSGDESLNLPKSFHCYTGSSGRDITLLPRLKIRIYRELSSRIKHSFDDVQMSDESFTTDESNTAENVMFHNHKKSNSHSLESTSTKHNRDVFTGGDSETNISICRKCGHKLDIHKQFTDSFL